MIYCATTACNSPSLNEILNSTHTFYNDAWSNLITFLSIAGGVIIIVIPILLALWQNSNIKLQKKDLLDSFNDILNKRSSELQKDKDTAVRDLQDRLETLKCQLETTGADIEERNRIALTNQVELLNDHIESSLTSRLSDIEHRIFVVKSEALGSIYHLQGNMNSQYQIDQLGDYCKAIQYYSDSNNERDIYTLLDSMIDTLNSIVKNQDMSIRGIFPILNEVTSYIDRMTDKDSLAKLIPVFEERLSHVKAMLAVEYDTPPDSQKSNM